jgi:hypothetical protein
LPDKRPRRLSLAYRKHLDAIALIYVRCGETGRAAARMVRDTFPHLKGFRDTRFRAWADNPEWQAALDAAREQCSVEKALPPESRGAKLLAFAQGALAEIEKSYAAAKRGGDEKEKKLLEERIIKLHDALRAEERHQDSLKTQAALRKFSAFISNVLALLKGLPAEYEGRLRDAMRDPAKLMGIQQDD